MSPLYSSYISSLPRLVSREENGRFPVCSSLVSVVQHSIGGRVTVVQTCLPTLGPGALKNRDINPPATKKVYTRHTALSYLEDIYIRLFHTYVPHNPLWIAEMLKYFFLLETFADNSAITFSSNRCIAVFRRFYACTCVWTTHSVARTR